MKNNFIKNNEELTPEDSVMNSPKIQIKNKLISIII